jgi:hypothetical protein
MDRRVSQQMQVLIFTFGCDKQATSIVQWIRQYTYRTQEKEFHWSWYYSGEYQV